jgi:hypothetical protein
VSIVSEDTVNAGKQQLWKALNVSETQENDKNVNIQFPLRPAKIINK